jgi:hypothetical protein
LLGRLVWALVLLVIAAALGRYLYLSSVDEGTDGAQRKPKSTAPIKVPVAWDAVDRELAAALQRSRETAAAFAAEEVGQWCNELTQRINEAFLDWYFSYLQQQWLGLKALGYWAAEQVLSGQPSMAEKITEEIQKEFAKRVLQPQIAQMRIERIADQTLGVYVASLEENISSIPDRYNIPRAEWHRYLDDIAVLSGGTEGNRRISLSLKTLVTASAAGSAAGAAYLVKGMKPVIAKIGTKASGKVAAKGAGKAAAKLAAKTGSKVGLKAGGKLLGPIIGIGVLVWDLWDHQHTRALERPLLRQNLMDYLDEMKHDLLHDPETGIVTLVETLEATMVGSLEARPARDTESDPGG